MMNLVLNARDAIVGQGLITVQTENVSITRNSDLAKWTLVPKIGEYVSLSVSDDGCGIVEDNLHAIFEPFFSTKDADKGTGLGLAVVHGIVRQNNGGLLVESRPNRGTRFVILVPVVQSAGSDIYRELRHVTPLQFGEFLLPDTGEQQSILLVDDEPSVVRDTEDVLAKLGYSVTATLSAQNALEMVRDEKRVFHLLITDYSMPHMSGIELVEQIREYLPNVPVILMSGFLDQSALRSLPPGLDPIFVQKPFRVEDLVMAIKKSRKPSSHVARSTHSSRAAG